MDSYHVYILGNESGTSLYTGVTNDLARRLKEHRDGAHEGFTCKTGAFRLLFYEKHNYIKNAIAREKQIKSGSRERKLELINKWNPKWEDLSDRFSPDAQQEDISS